MKQWLAALAIVALLAVPLMVSADGDTKIPPEANWSPTPSTPEVVALSQPRVASTAPEQTMVTGSSAAEENANYQAINSAAMKE